MKDLPRRKLVELMDGATPAEREDILTDPDVCKAELEDSCGAGYRREINVLVLAQRGDVIEKLEALEGGDRPIEPILEGLTDQLVDGYAIASEAARWAVDSWAEALELDVPKIEFVCTWDVEVLIHGPSDSANDWEPQGHTPGSVTIPTGYDIGLRPARMDAEQFSIWVHYLDEVERVKYLDLSGQGINGNSVELLTKFVNLQQLDLVDTNINDDGLKHVGKLIRLRHLDLRHCTEITPNGLEHLSSLKYLSTLDLGGTRVTNDSLEHISQLACLKYLALNDTFIQDGALTTLDELTSLIYLDLSSTRVGNATLASLCKYPNLNTLWLDDCESITNSALAHLCPLKKLRKLGISGTSIDDDGVIEYLSELGLTEVKLGRRWRETTERYLRDLGIELIE